MTDQGENNSREQKLTASKSPLDPRLPLQDKEFDALTAIKKCLKYLLITFSLD